MLKNLYNTGSYPFNFIVFDYTHNKKAQNYLSGTYNLYWVPSLYWDGGFIVQIGSSGISTNINLCKDRTVADIEADVDVIWRGNATMDISVFVVNNHRKYDGYLRVYVTETESSMNWKDYYGKLYAFPFLDFAMNGIVSIPASGGTYETTLNWNGNLHNDGYGHTFGGITPDNVTVFVALFDEEDHLMYSNPPSGAPFQAHYLDELVSAEPVFLATDTDALSETGGTVEFDVSPGVEYANRKYFLLGSVTGTEPGFPLPGGNTLPLNWDLFTGMTFKYANTPIFVDFYGTLNASGQASATFDSLGPLPPGFVGTKIYFAYLLYSPFDFVSNPVEIEVVP